MSDRWIAGPFVRTCPCFGNEVYDRIVCPRSESAKNHGTCFGCGTNGPRYYCGRSGHNVCADCAFRYQTQVHLPSLPVILIPRDFRFGANGIEYVREFVWRWRRDGDPKVWDILLGLFGHDTRIEQAMIAYCLDELDKSGRASDG